MLVSVNSLQSKITQIEYLRTSGKIAIGTKEGELLIFDFITKLAFLELSFFENEAVTQIY